MPAFLEKKLKAEYPNNPHAVYGTMNARGFMHGSKETAKGKMAEKKHAAKMKTSIGKMMGHKDSGYDD